MKRWTETETCQAETLWAEGHSMGEIGTAIGRTRQAVRSFILNHLDRFPEPDPAVRQARKDATAAAEERRKVALVAPLWRDGATQAEMATALGRTVSTVQRLMRTYPEDFARSDEADGVSARRQAARLDAAADLAAQGQSLREIGGALGVSTSTIKQLKAAHPERFPAAPAPVADSTIDRAAAMWASGSTATAIADALGMRDNVFLHIRRTNRARFPKRSRGAKPARAAPIGRGGEAAISPPVGEMGGSPEGGASARSSARSARVSPPSALPGISPARGEISSFDAGAHTAPPAKADAFRPLPSTEPARLWDACGCRWPVHVDGSDPMASATVFVCDAVQAVTGTTRDGAAVRSPWCAAHAAMASGEAEYRARRAA
ncbi:hypothetical protein [Aurantimonas sp. VKM B-3413]|uniref:hypothetical protein n=1 Tax=Aurantimonas sp. VKM B-3413 TaxID=2779401 RepID=UPI001E466E71|nr:hypothetical protein [Aurantimonas sp. VKM B-3413]MCB8835959.1 hypothetical protein [Aurantimonas sp. VKM B-3413]